MEYTQVKVLVVLLAIMWLSEAKAQDPIFSQFYAAPLQINPAFTGNTYTPNIALNARNQWSGWPGTAYATYAASVDQFIEPLNIGLGLMVSTDNAGNGLFLMNNLTGFFSYKVGLGNDWNVKLGVEAGAWQSRINSDLLVFGDQLDLLEGNNGKNNTQEGPILDDSRTILDISTGIIIYNPVFYAGLSIKHINTPNDVFLASSEEFVTGLPVRYSMHAGAQIVLKEGNKSRLNTFVSPNVLIERQVNLNQINIGAYGGIGSVFAGAWFRHTFQNSDAAIVLIGFRQKAFKIGYSYDFTVFDSLTNQNSAGSHEISVGINFDYNRRKINYNDCFNLFR